MKRRGWIALGVALVAGAAVAQTVPSMMGASTPFNGTEVIYLLQGGKDRQTTLGALLQYFLKGIGPIPQTPQLFGAKCDGVTDDAVALQNWLSGMQNTGITASISNLCAYHGTLNITDTIKVVGGGTDASGLTHLSTTGDMLSIMTIRPVELQSFQLQVNGSNWGTSGAAIAMNGANGGGVNNYNARSFFQNMRIRGTYDGIRMDNAAFFRTVGMIIMDYTHDGILKSSAANPDGGQDEHVNAIIQDLNRGGTSSANFEYQSGGDVKILASKLIGGGYGVHVNATYGPTGTVITTGNSLEEHSTGDAVIEQAVPGTLFGNFIMVGNQTSGDGTAGGRILWVKKGSAPGWVQNITFASNTENGARVGTFPAVDIEDGNNVVVVANGLNNNNQGSLSAIRVSDNATNVTLGPNQVSGYPGGTYDPAMITGSSAINGLVSYEQSLGPILRVFGSGGVAFTINGGPEGARDDYQLGVDPTGHYAYLNTSSAGTGIRFGIQSTTYAQISSAGHVSFPNMPTAAGSVSSGEVYNNAGVLTVKP